MKRFTDTDIWDKEWFMTLPPKLKCLVKLVRDKCDNSGVWSCNWVLAKNYVGEAVSEKELLSIDDGRQFEKIENGKIYCKGFIEFQYGSLSENCAPHKKIIAALKKHGIYEDVNGFSGRKKAKNEDVNDLNKDVNEGYSKGIDTLKEKEEEKEEYKDKEKEKDKEVKKPKIEIQVIPQDGMIYPDGFSENFRFMWEQWISYKWKVHKFKYKNLQTEQAALHELINLRDNEKDCAEIIRYSIGRQYKGFYLPETMKHGSFTGNSNNQQQGAGSSYFERKYGGNSG